MPKFQLSVLIVLRVDPANVGVGCANVLMANGFSNGSDARLIGCSSQQKSLCRLVAGRGAEGGGALCLHANCSDGSVSSATGCRRQWILDVRGLL